MKSDYPLHEGIHTVGFCLRWMFWISVFLFHFQASNQEPWVETSFYITTYTKQCTHSGSKADDKDPAFNLIAGWFHLYVEWILQLHVSGPPLTHRLSPSNTQRLALSLWDYLHHNAFKQCWRVSPQRPPGSKGNHFHLGCSLQVCSSRACLCAQRDVWHWTLSEWSMVKCTLPQTDLGSVKPALLICSTSVKSYLVLLALDFSQMSPGYAILCEPAFTTPEFEHRIKQHPR